MLFYVFGTKLMKPCGIANFTGKLIAVQINWKVAQFTGQSSVTQHKYKTQVVIYLC